MLRVVLVDPRRESQRAWWQGLFPADVAVGLVPKPDRLEGWRELLPVADVLVVHSLPISGQDLERASNLKLAVQIGLHQPSFELSDLAARGIPFRVERNPSNLTVAEHAFLLMLAVVRRLVPIARLMAEARDLQPRAPARTQEESYAYNWPGLEGIGFLLGRTLGLVGLGEIGLEVARRAKAFGMRVLYYKRNRLSPELEARLGVAYRPLQDLFGEVDVLSLHAPHTVETERMVGAAQLGRMKSTAVLVNTARGGLVDQDALIEALRSGRLAGAGLDVYREEPLPHDSELRRLENVILTPHTASLRPERAPGVFASLVENVARLARGEPPLERAEADLAYVTQPKST